VQLIAGAERGRKGCFQSALAVPTASKAATAMETPEATTDMAEAPDMGDTHAVREIRAPVMGGTKAAIHTYGATHPTHAMAGAVVEAVADFANPTPGGIGAMIEAALVRVATKYGGIAVIIAA